MDGAFRTPFSNLNPWPTVGSLERGLGIVAQKRNKVAADEGNCSYDGSSVHESGLSSLGACAGFESGLGDFVGVSPSDLVVARVHHKAKSRSLTHEHEPCITTPRQNQRLRPGSTFASVKANSPFPSTWQDLPASFLSRLLPTLDSADASSLQRICKNWRSACVELKSTLVRKSFTAEAVLVLDGKADIQPLPPWCRRMQPGHLHLILLAGYPHSSASSGAVQMPVPVFGPADIRELSHILRRLELDLMTCIQSSLIMSNKQASLSAHQPNQHQQQRPFLDLTITGVGCAIHKSHVTQALASAPVLQQMLRRVTAAH